jgi:hypothetical protein
MFDRDDQLAEMMEERGMTREQLDKSKELMDAFLSERTGWSPQGWIAEQPEVWEKTHPTSPLVLRQELHGVARRNQSWYDLRYVVIRSESHDVLLSLGPLDWAEWDINGDLLYAQKGCLYRAKACDQEIANPVLLADFNSLTFEAIAPPEEARRW